MVLRKVTYGLYVIGTFDGERPTGCIVNSVMQISSSPETVLVSINKDNFTTQCIEKTKRLSIGIIPEDIDPQIIGIFGYNSGRDINKFDKVDYSIKDNLPIVNQCCGFLTCSVIEEVSSNTHNLFICKVQDSGIINNEKTPMTYAYYHKVVKNSKPQAAKNNEINKESINEDNINMLQSNIEELDKEKLGNKESTEKKWRCKVCGYEYSGEYLPEDFVCPICGKGSEYFEEIN